MKRSFFTIVIGLACCMPYYANAQNLRPGDFVLKVTDNETGEIRQTSVKFEALKSMETDTVEAEGKYSTDNWIGPNFHSLSKILPFEIERIRRVVIKADDGYMSVLASDILSFLDMTVCAVAIEGIETFPAVFGKWRIVIAGLQPMYWVNEPNYIEIELGAPESPSGSYSIYLHNHPSWTEWIKSKNFAEPLLIKTVLDRFAIDIEMFYVLAIDGLFREYALTRPLYSMEFVSDENGYWKITGEKIPSGLKTNDIYYISSSSKGIFIKETTAAEFDLWENQVLNGFVLKNIVPDNCIIQLFHVDGQTSQTGKISQVYSGNRTFAKFIQKVKNDFPDVVRIDISW